MPPPAWDDGPVRWSVSVRDTATGAVLHEHGAARLLPTASVAKVFALVDLAARAGRGEVDLGEEVRRAPDRAVADSGLWQHLRVERLTLADVAVLVGATSDNWATNTLLDRLTLASVQARAGQLAPGGSTLHDYVRDDRGLGDPPTLSRGCADDWSRVLADLARGTCVDAATSALVRHWLSLNTDLSMVAAALHLDPLAHVAPDAGVRLWNKTGTDVGVRADVGVVAGGTGSVAYACLAAWDDDGSRATRGRVLDTMRGFGELVLGLADGPAPADSQALADGPELADGQRSRTFRSSRR